MRKFLVFICCSFAAVEGIPQQKVRFDTSAIVPRSFNSNTLNGYKADSDFQYDKLLEPAVSLWDRFWAYIWNKIGELLSTEAGKNTFVTVLIILAVSVLVFMVLNMMGMTKVGLFSNKNKSDALSYSVHDEDIHGISFEQAIEQAIQDGNLRLAVRLLYLQTLKKLSDNELINWQINKTNVSYIRELQGLPYQQEFVKLTMQFETNWYGDRQVDKNAFASVREAFNQFNQQLK